MWFNLAPYIFLVAQLLVFTSAGRDWFHPQGLSTNVMAKAAVLILHPPAPLPPLQVGPPALLPALPPPCVEPSDPDHPLPIEPSPDPPHLQITPFPVQPAIPPPSVRCSTGHGYDESIATPPNMTLTGFISLTGLPDADHHADRLKWAIEDSCFASNLATYEPRPTAEMGTLSVRLQIIVAISSAAETHAPPHCVDYALREFSGNPDFQWCSDHGW